MKLPTRPAGIVTYGTPAAPPPVVLIADDHELVRDGLRLLVTRVLGKAVFLEADDGDAVLRAAGSGQALQLALIHIGMPRMHGGLRVIELAHCQPQLPLIIFAAPSCADLLRRITTLASVRACLPPNAHRNLVRAAIQFAMLGREVMRDAHSTRRPAALTPRQQQIRALLRQGFSNKLIASQLGITEGTVKNHLTNLFRALNTTNRTQAAHCHPETE